MFQRHQWPKDLLAKDDARRKSLHGIKKPFSLDSEARDYNKAMRLERAMALSELPREVSVKPKRRLNGCFMSPAKRAMVVLREGKRQEFFEALAATRR